MAAGQVGGTEGSDDAGSCPELRDSHSQGAVSPQEPVSLGGTQKLHTSPAGRRRVGGTEKGQVLSSEEGSDGRAESGLKLSPHVAESLCRENTEGVEGRPSAKRPEVQTQLCPGFQRNITFLRAGRAWLKTLQRNGARGHRRMTGAVPGLGGRPDPPASGAQLHRRTSGPGQGTLSQRPAATWQPSFFYFLAGGKPYRKAAGGGGKGPQRTASCVRVHVCKTSGTPRGARTPSGQRPGPTALG